MKKKLNSYKFTHYKNKNYKYIGEATHSENLEKVTIYECLYTNEIDQIWTRPKGMFNETISLNGTQVPRFKKTHFTAELLTTNVADQLVDITELIQSVFDDISLIEINEKLLNVKRSSLIIAYDKDKAIGFKLGYEIDKNNYYSWLGGVDKTYRGLGIATDLIDFQYDWCKENRYSFLRTKTLNKWKSMLVLNIKKQFNITGTETCSKRGLKILLEKKIL